MVGFLVLGVVLLALVAYAVFASERSLRRQRGSTLKRSPEENRALSHAQTNATRSGGQGGA
jgi:hypothetical protein